MIKTWMSNFLSLKMCLLEYSFAWVKKPNDPLDFIVVLFSALHQNPFLNKVILKQWFLAKVIICLKANNTLYHFSYLLLVIFSVEFSYNSTKGRPGIFLNTLFGNFYLNWIGYISVAFGKISHSKISLFYSK